MGYLQYAQWDTAVFIKADAGRTYASAVPLSTLKRTLFQSTTATRNNYMMIVNLFSVSTTRES